MLIYEYFKDDNNSILKEIQFEMYSYSISTIFTEIKRIYLDNKYAILYLSTDEIEKYKNIDSFDHRIIQNTHDMIAAVFRFLVKDDVFEKDLFEKDNEQIKSLFNNIYTDTNFLDNIQNDYWHFAYKWHGYLIDYINKNIPLVHELVLSTLIYNNTPQKKLAFEAAERARILIKNQHNDILWITKELTEK